MLRLAIAGITMSVASDDPDLTFAVTDTTRRFLVDHAEPDVTIRAGWGDSGQFDEAGDVRFDSGPLWKLSERDGEFVFSFCSPVFGAAPYKLARFDSRFSRGQILFPRRCFQGRGALYPLEYPLDELLLINLLGRGRGVEVHACGLVEEGRGYLFLGQSGAGKSTTARLWKAIPGVTILSDDRIVVREHDGRIWMYGTPWHGDEQEASPEGAPLAGVFFLRQGTVNELTRVSAGASVAELFACSFLPFHDASALEFTLRFFEHVAQATPCFELRFTPDSAAVDVIRSREWDGQNRS